MSKFFFPEDNHSNDMQAEFYECFVPRQWIVTAFGVMLWFSSDSNSTCAVHIFKKSYTRFFYHGMDIRVLFFKNACTKSVRRVDEFWWALSIVLKWWFTLPNTIHMVIIASFVFTPCSFNKWSLLDGVCHCCYLIPLFFSILFSFAFLKKKK